jgi:hypothetical protein
MLKPGGSWLQPSLRETFHRPRVPVCGCVVERTRLRAASIVA